MGDSTTSTTSSSTSLISSSGETKPLFAGSRSYNSFNKGAGGSNNATTVIEIQLTGAETLQGLAIRFNVKVAEILKVNGLWAQDSIHGKKSLYIPITKTTQYNSSDHVIVDISPQSRKERKPKEKQPKEEDDNDDDDRLENIRKSTASTSSSSPIDVIKSPAATTDRRNQQQILDESMYSL
eukprot:TRINITY_DN3439_c1_g1_i1.p1 TRINITY_DN3439_c1_g1~~TRINITY_DN3439_c1_g1_i1.p1  ORF type:complete len:181 (-),score=63.84 TRINITY_DN3439_c1_g1_i1:229-771(-)